MSSVGKVGTDSVRGVNFSLVRKVNDLLALCKSGSLVSIITLMFIGMLFEALGVGLVVPALALLTDPKISQSRPAMAPILEWLGNPNQATLVMLGMLLLVGIYLVKTVFLALLVWYQTRFAFRLQADLSQHLFENYLTQPYDFHLRRNSAQLVANITNEVVIFCFHGILPGLLVLTESLVLFAMFSLMLYVEPIGALIVIGVLGSASWAFFYFTKSRISTWGESRRIHEGLRIQHIQQGLGGVKDVKILGREGEFMKRYAVHNFESARAGQYHHAVSQLPRLWLELLAVCGLAILVIAMLLQGHPPESILPKLGLFAAAAFRVMPSANRIVGGIGSLRYALPVVNTLHAELRSGPPRRPPVESAWAPLQNSLVLESVEYAYPEASGKALKGVSLEVRRGESVGFIGTSGAGKSTLVDVLLGLLVPNRGRVLMDGHDVHSNLRAWQDQVGYVPQTIFLTDDSLRANVAFGLPPEQIDDASVWRALRAAQLEELVTSLPDGLETRVGERGVRLSGGQRQRVGIARALYRDPAVLVLDEATSSLDGNTEADIMRSVRALQGSKTVVIVAHRLSTVAHCQRLYRLEGGQVVEVGVPGEVGTAEPKGDSKSVS